MKAGSVLALMAVGCAPERFAPPDDAREGSRYAEGTPEALLIVRAANELTYAELDDGVPLDKRAATNLVDGRNGPDNLDGTADDTPYSTLAAVDAVKYVGEGAMEAMLAYALLRWPPPPAPPAPIGTWSAPVALGASVVATGTGVDDHGNVAVVWSETVGTSREKSWLDWYHPSTGWAAPAPVCGGSDATDPVVALAGDGYAIWGARCRLSSATSGPYDGLFHGGFVLGPDGSHTGTPGLGSSMSLGYYYPNYGWGALHAAISPGGRGVIELPMWSEFGDEFDQKHVEAYDFHWLNGDYLANVDAPSVVDDQGQRSSAWIVGTQDRYVYGSGMGSTSERIGIGPDIGYRGLGPSYATAPDGNGVVAWAQIDPSGVGAPGATLGIRRWGADLGAWEDLDIAGRPQDLIATIDRSGNVFVAWIEEAGTVRQVRAAVQRPGEAWASAVPETLAETTGYGPLRIAADAVGQVHLVWPDRPADGTYPLTWTTYVPDAGWSEVGTAVADVGTNLSWTREDFRLVAGGDGGAALSWKTSQLWVTTLVVE